MTDTIRELINRVLDYVARTPGAYFGVRRWSRGIIDKAENQMAFAFWRNNMTHFVSRDGDKQWSLLVTLTEDNLRYLLERLEDEER